MTTPIFFSTLNSGSSDSRNLCRIFAMVIFCSCMAKFWPIQFLQRKNTTCEFTIFLCLLTEWDPLLKLRYDQKLLICGVRFFVGAPVLNRLNYYIITCQVYPYRCFTVKVSPVWRMLAYELRLVGSKKDLSVSESVVLLYGSNWVFKSQPPPWHVIYILWRARLTLPK